MKQFEEKGFAIIENVFSSEELKQIAACIDEANSNRESFLKQSNLFAIRQLLINIPTLIPLLFTNKLKELLSAIGSKDYFLTKALYFDKPRLSNWFVPYHQDLSISVNKKQITEGYKNWTFKKEQYGVQPPTIFLERTITIRIHIDEANENNGALKVIPTSHLNGIILEKKKVNSETICCVTAGGVMLMSPLLLHSSNRNNLKNNSRRRVIHLEFCDKDLDKPLEWLEKLHVFQN